MIKKKVAKRCKMDIIREATKLKKIALSIAKTKGLSNLEAWPEAISIYKLKYENYFE